MMLLSMMKGVLILAYDVSGSALFQGGEFSMQFLCERPLNLHNILMNILPLNFEGSVQLHMSDDTIPFGRNFEHRIGIPFIYRQCLDPDWRFNEVPQSVNDDGQQGSGISCCMDNWHFWPLVEEEWMVVDNMLSQPAFSLHLIIGIFFGSLMQQLELHNLVLSKCFLKPPLVNASQLYGR